MRILGRRFVWVEIEARSFEGRLISAQHGLFHGLLCGLLLSLPRGLLCDFIRSPERGCGLAPRRNM